MKLDSSMKRAGIVLIIFSVGLFLIIGLIHMFAAPQLVAHRLTNGNIIYLERGVTENMILHGIETALIIFPIFACGVILLLGNGKRLFNWIKNGPKPEDPSDDSHS